MRPMTSSRVPCGNRREFVWGPLRMAGTRTAVRREISILLTAGVDLNLEPPRTQNRTPNPEPRTEPLTRNPEPRTTMASGEHLLEPRQKLRLSNIDLRA